MRIVICGSMTFSKRMIEVKKELIEHGHTVVLPKFTKDYAESESVDYMHAESVKNKVKHALIHSHFNEIKQCDAILIINETRHKIDNYIGGNSFLEMGFAYVLSKKIFLLNPIPNMIYADEIKAMQPLVINGDFNKIR